jgi:Flp pilus assembly protein TadD
VGGEARFDAYIVQTYLGADDAAEASRACEQALTRHPEDPRLQILKAQVLYEEGHEEQGLKLLVDLSAAAPEDEMLAGAVANYLHGASRFEDAESHLNDAIERIPENARLLFQLGAVLERQGRVDEAEAAFTKVLGLNPESAGALNYLGYMLADRGLRLEESLGYIQQAVALDPYNGAYLDSLGWVYFRLGELELAEENLLKAIERLRTTGVVYDHLGDLYYRKGNRDEALRFWRKAMEQEDEELEKDQVAQKIEKARSGQDLPR